LIFAEGRRDDALGELTAIDHHPLTRFEHSEEINGGMKLCFAVYFGDSKEGTTDLLDLVLTQVLHDLRGDLFAEAQEGQSSFFWIR